MNEKADRMREMYGPMPPGITDAEIIAVYEDSLSWQLEELRAAFADLFDALRPFFTVWWGLWLWAFYIVIYLTLEYLL